MKTIEDKLREIIEDNYSWEEYYGESIWVLDKEETVKELIEYIKHLIENA